MTPQVRSLNYLRDRGWTAVTVESLKRFPDKHKQPCPVCHSQPQVMVRVDLFGFADIIAFNATNVLLVQSTTRHNMLERWKKIAAIAEARLWVSGTLVSPTERLLAVHGWYQKGRFWQLKEKLVTPSDFDVTRCADFDDVDEVPLPF